MTCEADIILVDHQDTLAKTLSANGFRVSRTDTEPACLEHITQSAPDLLIVDTETPAIDPLDLLEHVRDKSPVPIILLSTSGENIDEILGLTVGADDVISKPVSERLLLTHIKALLRRVQTYDHAHQTTALDTRLYRYHDLSLDKGRHLCLWKGASVDLTVTEFLMLCALAEHPGYVKNRVQLIQAAHDAQIYVDERTIDSHIKRIRYKFRQVDPDFQAIETLYGVGYRYREATAGL